MYVPCTYVLKNIQILKTTIHLSPNVGMSDIDILAYDYCEASISQLSRLLHLLYLY